MYKPKIVLLGAGSVVFSKNTIADILAHEALATAEIRLVDIDPERLAVAKTMAERINTDLGTSAEISAVGDRRRALDEADFVVCCIGVGGYEATRIDHEVPAAFGLRQTVGDTLGIGGIFRAVRSIPELLRIAADMEELCPNALLISYVNPMAMHCLALERAANIRYVGICHGVQGTAQTMRMLTAMLEIDPEVTEKHFSRAPDDPERIAEWERWFSLGEDPELSYTCAGINHLAFFLRFESGGTDLYPVLRKVFDLPHLLRFDPVRFALFRRLGYFMTETSHHTAEYVPYFLADDGEIAGHDLEVSIYLRTCERQDRQYNAMRGTLDAGDSVISLPYRKSKEYVSRIINAVITGKPYVFNGNVHNRGGALISNLPGDSCIEVPCVADRQGIHPTAIGELPPQCAAMIRSNIGVQDLTVRGILENRRDHIFQAAMLDPNTASQLTLDRIDELVEAMFKAHGERIPENLR